MNQPNQSHPGRAGLIADAYVASLRGEVTADSLRIGEKIATLAGNGPPLKPILDIRHATETIAPIRICAGAFDDEVPHRDLLVAPAHALYSEGVLVPIWVLVNGATIVQEPPAKVDIVDVEVAEHEGSRLPVHEVQLANGLAVETWRRLPDAEPVDAQPARPGQRWVPRDVNATPAAPTVPVSPTKLEGPEVEELRTRALARAAAMGFTLTEDPDLYVDTEDGVVRASSITGTVHHFVLPGPVKSLRVRTRSSVPAWLGGTTDPRLLGIAINGLRRDGKDLALDGPALKSGWQDTEKDGPRMWRWTNGDAVLSLSRPTQTIDISVMSVRPYWILGRAR